jgi:uncharacterized protein
VATLAPMRLSRLCNNIIESRRFYGNILECEERRATRTSVKLHWFGNQLTVHQLDSYNAKRMLGEVEGDDVPVAHFGAVLDENLFLRAAARLKQGGWSFVIPPYKRYRDQAWEQWVLVVRDPSGNAVELKSFAKIPAGTWA